MKRAIVLSGGGGKGGYQIGVWKALRKLHIKYDIVTGTSVGALNGAYMVQKEYIKALIVWKHMGFNTVYNTGVEKDTKIIKGKKEVVTMYAKGIVLDGGMDIANLENLIDKSLSEKKFRKSSVDYGLITFNLTKLKALSIAKKEIPEGKLKDYLLASSTCYPVFKKKEIEKVSYIDGGMYDNLPINLALELGAEEVIAVDLKAVGIKQKVKPTKAKITIISPRNKIGSFLVFDELESNRAIRLGYNDAMKTFGKLDGDKFTFKKDHLYKNYKKHGKMFIGTVHSIFHFTRNKSLMDKIVTISAFNKIFKKGTEEEMLEIMDKTMEYLGKVFDMNEENIYNVAMYNRVLIDKMNQEKLNDESDIDKLVKLGTVKKLLNTAAVIKYIYIKMGKAEESRDYKKELSSLALVFSKEFLGALYLYTITS